MAVQCARRSATHVQMYLTLNNVFVTFLGWHRTCNDTAITKRYGAHHKGKTMNADKTKDEIEKATVEYRKRLERKAREPVLTKEQKERKRQARLHEQLHKAEVATQQTDAKRVRELLRLSVLKAKNASWADIHALALEVAAQTRTMVLGAREVHPILSSRPPPPKSLPPSDERRGEYVDAITSDDPDDTG